MLYTAWLALIAEAGHQEESFMYHESRSITLILGLVVMVMMSNYVSFVAALAMACLGRLTREAHC